MYIRKVEKRNGSSDKKYSCLHLVESVRTEKGPRQRLVLNLGTLDIDARDYRILAKRIEELLTGSGSLFPVADAIEKHARSITDRIISKKAVEEPQRVEADAFEQIDPESLGFSHARSLGAEYAAHEVYRDLGIESFLRGQGVNESAAALIEALVVCRCVNPGSELHSQLLCENTSAIFELTGEPARRSLSSYYRAGDILWKHKDRLEEHLTRKEEALFDLEGKLILYDLTNTRFEGSCAGNPKAGYGRSKQKRGDCRLQTLALVADGSGFVRFSKLYAGNQHEASTLSDILNDLDKHQKKSIRTTVVLDAGIAAEENLNLLKERNYSYIVVSRSRKAASKARWEDIQSNTIRENKDKGIKIEVKRYEEEREVYLQVHSERKKQKEAAMTGRVEQLLVERLQCYRDGLAKKGRTKRYDKIVEMVGRLKEKYAKAACLYDIQVIPDRVEGKVKTVNAADIIWKKKDAAYQDKMDSQGSCLLRSDRLDLEDREIWELYIALSNIEKAFKDMKSHLGLRPNFHQKEERVDTHMFIPVVAYHIIHAIEHRLRANGDHRSWGTIKTLLASHQRISLQYTNRDEYGNFYNNILRMDGEPEGEQQEIYFKLGLSGRALNRKKTKYQIRSDHERRINPDL